MDQRKTQLDVWVSAQLGLPVGKTLDGTSASSDASFRRYFRYQVGERSVIAMDAPPPQEDCRPFVRIGRQLAAAGIAVPTILADDIERGFLLLSDLGTQPLIDVIDESNADDFFQQAIATLVQIQQVSDAELPVYDEALLRRELALFPDWYLAKECGVTLSAAERADLDDTFDRLVAAALAQPRVFVHRDYMPRNLMVGPPLAVLDFQDAVSGPISYDITCLFKDAFVSWPQQRVTLWLRQYWQQAQKTGLPVPADFATFCRASDWIGIHRHLKVIGIFARICHRDGKPRYLRDVPRFFEYLIPVVARYPELKPLGDLLGRYRSVTR